MNEHNYRLLYIWIDNYKNIHRKGIQVTLDYHITKNNDEITVEKTLFAELNDNPLNQLDAFSAIVGKNGAGKSHFLHIIRQVLCNGYFPDDVTKSFAIFEITMNNCDKQLVMLTTQPKQYQFLSGSMISNLPSEKIQVIEYNPFNYDLEYTCDLSTHNNLRRIDSYHSISSLHQTEILKRAEQLSLSKEAMVYKALESVNKNPHAHFVVRYSDLLESVQACSPIRLNSKSRLEKEWMTAFRDYFKSKIQESNYDIEMFILCYCFLFWRELLNQYKKELSQSFKASINEVSLAFMMITLFSGDNNHKLSFYIQTASKYFEKKDSPDASPYYPVPSFQSLRKARELRSLNSYFKVHSDMGACISIPFKKSEELSKLLFDYSYNDYNSGTYKKEYIGYNFVFKIFHVIGLSSGEKQIIHFLGKLQENLIKINGKQAIILIDEIESTFHPEWQRNFINIISSLFNMIEKTHKNFKLPQVVMVTHSPFILSDILNGKTLSLDSKDNHSWNTFGANIHELLSQSFFMERNIGESAAKIIINCAKEIDELNNESPSQQIEKIRFIINNLADPLIKNHLLRRLDSIVAKKSKIQQQLRILFENNLPDEEIIEQLKKLTGID